MKNLNAGGCALALIYVSLNANAATVIAVNGDSGSSGGGASLAYEYGAESYTSILAVGWTSSLSFTDVAITAQIASNNPVGATGHAFLTTRLGDGTTISDQVAATSFVFPTFTGTFSGQLTLFSGLNLTAGTPYFLTIAPDSGFTAGWNYPSNSIITSDDPGLTTQPPSGYYLFVHDFHPGPGPAPYTPASAFIVPTGGAHGQIYAVTGTIVPEPSAIALLGFGLVLTYGRRR